MRHVEVVWKVWCVVAISLVVGYMHSPSLFNCKYNIKMREKKKKNIPLGGAQDAFKAPFFHFFSQILLLLPFGPFFFGSLMFLVIVVFVVTVLMKKKKLQKPGNKHQKQKKNL